MKTGDSFRYPQDTFLICRSHCKLQKWWPWKSVKSKENMENSKNFQKFHCFYHQKYDFPASKSTSECFLYPPNLSKSVKQSLRILVYTHKMIFGRLDHIKETIRKLVPKRTYRTPFCSLLYNKQNGHKFCSDMYYWLFYKDQKIVGAQLNLESWQIHK